MFFIPAILLNKHMHFEVESITIHASFCLSSGKARL